MKTYFYEKIPKYCRETFAKFAQLTKQISIIRTVGSQS